MTNRTKKGTFKAGVSGNERGRPVGSGDAAKWRAALGKDAHKVIATVVRLAIAGQPAACRLVLERCVPQFKPMDSGVPLPMPTAGTLTDKAHAMIDAMAKGAVSPQAAAAMIGALASLVKVTEVDDVVRRITALEVDLHREQKP